MRIHAYDLSLTRTGYCLNGCIGSITPKTRGYERLRYIRDEIIADTLMTPYPPDLVVLEGYSFGSKGRAVFQIAGLGEIIRLALHEASVPFVDVAPGALKKYATGSGNANKDSMIAAAIRRFGFEGSDNNEADAYLLWCMAKHGTGDPVASVPQVQAEAANKIDWTE